MGEVPNRRGAKQQRRQIGDEPYSRSAKQQRCKIAEVLVCKQMKDDKRIQRAALTTIHKTKINTRKTEVWQSSTHQKCQTEEVHQYKTDKKTNRRGTKQKRCQITEAPNRRGAKQQRFWYAKKRKTTNGSSAQHYIQYTKNITVKKIEVWQSSTHWKCQTEEVHLYKTDEKPNRRGTKQKRRQIAEAPDRRRAKQQRCKIAEVLVCSKPKEDERIWRAALITIYKKGLLQDKQKFGNQAHI